MRGSEMKAQASGSECTRGAVDNQEQPLVRWRRTPLLYVLLIGLGLFGLSGWRSSEVQNDDRRRLAQETKLLNGNVSAINDPATEKSVRISFRQLCFSFDREGERARGLAARSFQQLAGGPVDSNPDVANLADHVKLPSYYGDQTPAQVAHVFGGAFARSLFVLKPGGWQGPIESGLGWHLVWVDSITLGASAFA